MRKKKGKGEKEKKACRDLVNHPSLLVSLEERVGQREGKEKRGARVSRFSLSLSEVKGRRGKRGKGGKE